MRAMRNGQRFGFGALLALGLAGCGAPAALTGAAPSPSAAQPETPSSTITTEAQTAAPSQPALTQVALSPQPTATLSPGGPWLVIENVGEFWAANADGSALIGVAGTPNIAPGSLLPAFAARGGHVAYMTSGEDVGLELNVFSLPTAHDYKAVTRLNPNAAPISTPDIRNEAVEAITMPDSLAWSPDGGTLAFIGAMNGPSADVYTYTLADGSIKQLTSGASQAYQLSWSPDGKYVLHAGASEFGTGAGHSMAGVWAARADGSEVRPLYKPTSGDERFVGWMSPTVFLVYSWDAACGARDLRSFDIDSGQQVVRTATFDEDGLAVDHVNGDVVYSIDSFAAQCRSAEQAGTYLLNLGQPGATLVSAQVARDIQFAPQVAAFFGKTDTGAVEIKPDGTTSNLAAPIAATPLISPDGRAWAWRSDGFNTSPGVWIGPFGGAVTPITRDVVPYATWSPDSKYLFFISESGLYRVDASGVNITRLAGENSHLTSQYIVTMAWVSP